MCVRLHSPSGLARNFVPLLPEYYYQSQMIFNFGPPQAEIFDILVLLLRDFTLKMREIARYHINIFPE